MPVIKVINRDGVETEINAPLGTSLMEILRDNNLDVEGTCGGSISCGSCHVYVNEAFKTAFPADDFETALLDELVHTQSNSRLSCQMLVTDAFEGLRVTVAPLEM